MEAGRTKGLTAEHSAAVSLQAAGRGWLGRREAESRMVEERDELEVYLQAEAATALQAAQRGRLGRHEVRRRHNALEHNAF